MSRDVLFDLIIVLAFGSMIALGIGLVVSRWRKEKRCTEEKVCPLLQVRNMSRRVNGRTQRYKLGTIEYNAYGKNVRDEFEIPLTAEVGQTVTIWINPYEPEEFVYKGSANSPYVLGVVLILTGILAMFLGLKYI